MVGKWQVIGVLSLGATYRFATGRSVTPAVGASYQPDGDYYLPVEGAVNSERLPDFHRLDPNVSYYWPFGSGNSVTFYCSVSNALNRNNITDYTFNRDYSERIALQSNYKRFVYGGG